MKASTDILGYLFLDCTDVPRHLGMVLHIHRTVPHAPSCTSPSEADPVKKGRTGAAHIRPGACFQSKGLTLTNYQSINL